MQREATLCRQGDRSRQVQSLMGRDPSKACFEPAVQHYMLHRIRDERIEGLRFK